MSTVQETPRVLTADRPSVAVIGSGVSGIVESGLIVHISVHVLERIAG